MLLIEPVKHLYDNPVLRLEYLPSVLFGVDITLGLTIPLLNTLLGGIATMTSQGNSYDLIVCGSKS